PCIGTGANSVVPADALDLLGNLRIWPRGGVVDMGCYEHGSISGTNNPPTAVLAAIGTTEANTTGGANVTLDGSGSTDPENDPLTYAWDFDGDGTIDSTGSSPTASHFYALGGPLTATLTVTDDDAASDSATAEITVVDTTPPTITAPAAVKVAEQSPSGTAVNLGTPTVTDICDDSPTVTNDAPSLFLAGETTVTWTATDAEGNASPPATQLVTIEPGEPENQLDNLGEAIGLGVTDGSIAAEIQGSLMSKVTAALTALADNRPNDAKIAANNLKAFINEVRAQTDKKIDDATAAALIARANQVIVDLGYAPQIIDGGRMALVTNAMAVPTATGAQIVFTLSDTTYVTVEVVNIAGRPVRTISSHRGLLAGVNTVLWDGRSEMGTKVPNGTYLVRITAHGPNGSTSGGLTTLRLSR
ncbi:MAG: HYR domain-containing protein, partial [Armatimonadetes bacterium]|nr:HYR domain-containing protein [Armatimonadota bacterium]